MKWKLGDGEKLTLVCSLDLAIQYQFLARPGADATMLNIPADAESPTNATQHSPDSEPDYSQTARILFCCCVVKLLVTFLLCQLCVRDMLPKTLLPHLRYVMMTMTYLFCALIACRVLVDSEPPSTILRPAYIVTLIINVAIAVLENVQTNAFLKPHIPAETPVSDKGKKKDDDEEETRKMPFLTMAGKFSQWFKVEWRWIVFSYVLLFIGEAGTKPKFPNSLCSLHIGFANP